MRWRQNLPALLAGLAVLVGTAPGRAQEVEIRAAAPANATVHRVGEADWKDAFCVGKREVDVQVPPGRWIEMPIAWIAVDEATARANWKSMTYNVVVGDGTRPLPAGLRWETSRARLDCPRQTITGFAMGPVLYLPPARAERSLVLEHVVDADLNDGWSAFKKGAKSRIVLRLHPSAEKAAPAATADTKAAPQRADPALVLPQLTSVQRWTRLETMWSLWVLAAAAQAKALGKTPDDFGRFAGAMYSPTWGKTLTPAGLVRGYYVNGSIFRDFKLELLEVSDTLVKARCNRPWVAALGATRTSGGVTDADLDRVLEVAYQELAEQHALRFEQVREGQDLVLTVRRK